MIADADTWPERAGLPMLLGRVREQVEFVEACLTREGHQRQVTASAALKRALASIDEAVAALKGEGTPP